MAEAVKVTTEDPELASRFDRALTRTVEAMEESGLKYVFIGGIAASGLGRPRSTHDIDIFVRPEDAELALRALAKKGFRTEKTDPVWLYKAFYEDILVDVIFKSKGEIYLDSEMYQRITTAEYHGKRIRLVSPEDLIIIKAAAHSELTPGHWHDALALLSYSNLDWDYLIRRARRAPRRILSLLLYAQSADIWVPNHVIIEMHRDLFGDAMPRQTTIGAQQQKPTQQQRVQEAHVPKGPVPIPPTKPALSVVQPSQQEQRHPSKYRVGHLREKLAQDSRCNEMDIEIDQDTGGRVVLRGTVATDDRKQIVERIARETFPEVEIVNEIGLVETSEPTEIEEVK